MGAQVTLSSGTPSQQARLLSHLIESKDGAWHHMVVLEAGKLGLTESRHGSEDRWDWGVTARSLDDAWLEWKRRDGFYRRMTDAQRALMWGSDTDFARGMRQFMRGWRR